MARSDDRVEVDWKQLRDKLGLRYRKIGWAGAGRDKGWQRDVGVRAEDARRGEIEGVSFAGPGIFRDNTSRERRQGCVSRELDEGQRRVVVQRGGSFPRECEDVQGRREGARRETEWGLRTNFLPRRRTVVVECLD